MRVLFIGGTGNISTAATCLLAERGIDVVVLNRGQSDVPLADGVPTIVRPSYTYGERWIPTALDGTGYTIVDRMLRGKQVIVPGDGESLWTMTHNTDFARGLVGILGNAAAVGEEFHITSDEVLTWNQITEAIAAAELAEGLLGDKAHSLVFDNSKLKRFVPGFQVTVPLVEGLARSLAWFEADPARQVVDEERDALLDRIVAAYAG